MNGYLNEIDKSEIRIMNNRIRRNRELKRHILLFSLSLILMIFLSFIFFSTKSVAASEEEKVYKCYMSVQIESGDTLSSLTEEYMTPEYSSKKFMEEIRYINNLEEDDLLVAGSFIIIPCYING